jgi:hypothetical protein
MWTLWRGQNDYMVLQGAGVSRRPFQRLPIRAVGWSWFYATTPWARFESPSLTVEQDALLQEGLRQLAHMAMKVLLPELGAF